MNLGLSAGLSIERETTTMIKFRHVLSTLLASASVLLLSGCHAMVLNPKGIIAVQERHVMFMALGLMFIIVIPVLIATLLIARRYRASNTKAKYDPSFSHSNMLEFLWWIVPIIIVIFLSILAWKYSHSLDPYKPLAANKNKPITVQVVALRWKWLFIYPDQDIATVNYLQFPVHTAINLYLTSDAPMNAFQIPSLGGQIYTMNGMQTKLHIRADQQGVYRGRSVSFSGNGFAGMQFPAKVTSKAAFDKWVHKVKQSHKVLSMAEYNKLEKPSENVPAIFYSQVKNNLFHDIVMRFMKPNMHNVNKSELGVHL